MSRSIERSKKRKFIHDVWAPLTNIRLNGDDTYDPRRGTACRSKPVNFRCTDRGCRDILKRGCTPYRQGVVEICHTSREQTWCLVSNSIEFLPITTLFSQCKFEISRSIDEHSVTKGNHALRYNNNPRKLTRSIKLFYFYFIKRSYSKEVSSN